MGRISFVVLLVLSCFAFGNSSNAEDMALSAADLRAAVVGETLSGALANGKDLDMTINQDGTMVVDFGSRSLEGTWKIMPDGAWCRTIRDEEKCQSVKRNGGEISFINENGSVSSTFALK